MSVFKAKMHQRRFRLGLAPDPARGAYSAPPNPLAVFKGAYTSKGSARGKEAEEKGKGKWRERGERGTPAPAPNAEYWLRHCVQVSKNK